MGRAFSERSNSTTEPPELVWTGGHASLVRLGKPDTTAVVAFSTHLFSALWNILPRRRHFWSIHSTLAFALRCVLELRLGLWRILALAGRFAASLRAATYGSLGTADFTFSAAITAFRCSSLADLRWL